MRILGRIAKLFALAGFQCYNSCRRVENQKKEGYIAMRKKKICILLAITMCTLNLAACSGSKVNDPAESSSASTEVSSTETTEPSSSESQENPGTDTPDDVIPESDGILGLKKVELESYYSDEERGNYGCVDVKRTFFLLDEDTSLAYPELSSALSIINSDMKAEVQETMNALKATYEAEVEEAEEFYDSFEDKVSCEISRADDYVLSWTNHYSGYTGGAHGYYSISGTSYNPQTGKQLALTDIISTESGLKKLLGEKLEAAYGDIFFSDVHDMIMDYTMEQFTWSMDYSGITFYFNPYELASFADGIQTVTLLYDDYPDMIDPKFSNTPDNYAIAMTEDMTYMADVDHDGTKETITYGLDYVTEEEYGFDYTPYILVDGEKLTCSMSDYSNNAYLIKSEGDFYVYVFHSIENDYSILEIANLKSKKVIGSNYEYANYYMNCDWNYTENGDTTTYRTDSIPFVNPENFEMSSTMDILSTYSGTKTYYVGKNGIPASDDEFYATDTSFLLQSLDFVPCSTVDEAGNVIEKDAKLAPGKFVRIIRTTDNSVDLVIANDYYPDEDSEYYYGFYIGDKTVTYDMSTIYRVTLDQDDLYQINGVSISEWFEGLMFAG